MVSLLPFTVSCITSIGKDHLSILGEDLGSIAEDKALMAVPKTDLVLGPDLPEEAVKAIRRIGRQNELRLREARFGEWSLGKPGPEGTMVTFNDSQGEKRMLLPLPGAYQLNNLITTVEIARVLEMDQASFFSGIPKANWPGRLEYFSGKPDWLLDCAHNRQGMAGLSAHCNSVFTGRNRVFLFGSSKLRELEVYLSLLPEIADQLVLTDDFYKAISVEEISRLIREQRGLKVYPSTNFEDALARIKGLAGEEGLCICSGSVFLVGKVRDWLITSRSEPIFHG